MCLLLLKWRGSVRVKIESHRALEQLPRHSDSQNPAPAMSQEQTYISKVEVPLKFNCSLTSEIVQKAVSCVSSLPWTVVATFQHGKRNCTKWRKAKQHLLIVTNSSTHPLLDQATAQSRIINPELSQKYMDTKKFKTNSILKLLHGRPTVIYQARTRINDQFLILLKVLNFQLNIVQC